LLQGFSKNGFEDFVDEDTGEVVSIDRNEIILEARNRLEDDHIDMIIDAGVKTGYPEQGRQCIQR